VTEEEPWLGLAEAVDAVRSELLKARELGEHSDMPFDVGGVELQFTVAMARERKTGGGIKVWVVGVDGTRTGTASHAHQVTVTLQPRAKDGTSAARIGADDGHMRR
jgi:hypothetical protein